MTNKNSPDKLKKDSIKLIDLKEKITQKEKQEILKRTHITAKDIYLISPKGVGKGKAETIRNQVLDEMKKRGYTIIEGKPIFVSTRLYKEMFYLPENI